MTGTRDPHSEIRALSILHGLDAEDKFIASANLASTDEPHDDPASELVEEINNECSELVHSEYSAHHHAPDIVSHAAQAAGEQARNVVADLDADEAERRKPRARRAITEVKHVNKDALFNLISLPERQRMLLASFLGRRSRNQWMRDQWLYVQEASLAAAHGAMAVYADLNQGRCADGTLSSIVLSGFDGNALLNCGTRVPKEGGQAVFIRCHQPFYCRQCNRWERLEPAKGEFLPRFDKAPFWYGLTVVGVSDPDKAGVKVRTRRRAQRALRQQFAGASDTKGYVRSPVDNLVPGVRLEQFEDDLRKGAGDELRMKFCALHSSAALAVNTFAPFKVRL